MTKTQLKLNARAGFIKEYGFAPSTKDIILLEASDNGDYLMVEVNGKQYQMFITDYFTTQGSCFVLEHKYRVERYK